MHWYIIGPLYYLIALKKFSGIDVSFKRRQVHILKSQSFYAGLFNCTGKHFSEMPIMIVISLSAANYRLYTGKRWFYTCNCYDNLFCMQNI